MPELTSDADLRRVLSEAKTIAVLGAHPDEARPAHYVPAYLHDHGYRIIPVNSQHAGKSWWGEPVRATLPEVELAVDIVDVFRRADKLDEHVPEILAMQPRPKLVWLQLGIRNDAFARQMLDEGIQVVQDRCALAEHRRLLGAVG
jgi:predicted CoA-binding protein